MNPKETNNPDGAPLNDKLLGAIARHLNQDHGEDLLACAQANAPLDWAEQAKVNQLDASAITIEVSSADQAQLVRLEFPTPAGGVLALRQRLGTMVAESRTQLGWPVASDRDVQ